MLWGTDAPFPWTPGVKLEWRPHPNATSTGSISTSGRYSVSSIKEGVWQAWKLAPGGPWFAMLGMPTETKDAAEALCQADADR